MPWAHKRDLANGLLEIRTHASQWCFSPGGRWLITGESLGIGEGNIVRISSLRGDSMAEIEFKERIVHLLAVSPDELWVLVNESDENKEKRAIFCLSIPDGGQLARLGVHVPGMLANLRSCRGDSVLVWGFLRLGTAKEREPVPWFLFSRSGRCLEREISTVPLVDFLPAMLGESPIEWVPSLNPDGDKIVCRANIPSPRPQEIEPCLASYNLLHGEQFTKLPGTPGGAIRGLRWVGRNTVLDLGFDRRSGGVILSTNEDHCYRQDGRLFNQDVPSAVDNWGGMFIQFAVDETMSRLLVWGMQSSSDGPFLLLLTIPELEVLSVRRLGRLHSNGLITPCLFWRGQNGYMVSAIDATVTIRCVCSTEAFVEPMQIAELVADNSIRSLGIVDTMSGSVAIRALMGAGDYVVWHFEKEWFEQ